MIGDLWCERCPSIAVDEYRQPDGSTVALCRECVLDQRWKEGNVNWERRPQCVTHTHRTRSGAEDCAARNDVAVA